jgi:hypothetical protein
MEQHNMWQFFRNTHRYRPALMLGCLLILAGCASAPPVKAPPVAEKTVVQQRGPVTFVHPLPGARISASFARYIVKSRNRQHHGVDFAAPTGTPVFAASAGVVLSADNTSLSEAFGNAVLIEHGDQLTSLSAHLSRLDVELGQWVEAGQQIGLVGQTGRATGPHLHFELWRGSVPQDPIALLPLSPRERKQALAEMQRQAAASKAPAGRVASSTAVSKQTVHARPEAKKSAARQTIAKKIAVNPKASTKKAAGKTKQTSVRLAQTPKKPAAKPASKSAPVAKPISARNQAKSAADD